MHLYKQLSDIIINNNEISPFLFFYIYDNIKIMFQNDNYLIEKKYVYDIIIYNNIKCLFIAYYLNYFDIFILLLSYYIIF